MVVGVDIQLLDEPPSGQIHQAHFSCEQSQANDVEIEELLRKGVIVPCNHTEGEFVSPIFNRPKKDNRVSVILNLKKFNVNVENFHFKMETLKHALTLVSPNCFFLFIRPTGCLLLSAHDWKISELFEIWVERAVVQVYRFS